MFKLLLLMGLFSFSLFSRAEFPDEAVIEDIEKKEAILDKRDADLKKREQELDAKEKALAGELRKLEDLKKEIEGIKGLQSKKQEENVGRMVEMVGSMSPKNSAALLSKVEEDLAVDVLSKLPSQKVGKVLNQMDVTRSSRLMERLALGKKEENDKSQLGSRSSDSSDRNPAGSKPKVK